MKMPALFALLSLSLELSSPANAARSISSLESFRVGTSGVLCSAGSQSENVRFGSMFDRAYELVCRDAATSVGNIYVLHGNTADARRRFDNALDKDLVCAAPTRMNLAEAGAVERTECTSRSNGLKYATYVLSKSGAWYASSGLLAYDSVLQLGFRTMVSDHPVKGEVVVATTNAGDPAAFARVQAEHLDAAQALEMGYSRNGEGNFADAAEFFSNLVDRSRGGNASTSKSPIYLINLGLQQSNLGHFEEANQLFSEAQRAADGSDPLFTAQYRNFLAMHNLNMHDPNAALEALTSKVILFNPTDENTQRLAQGYLDRTLSQRLAVDDDAMARLGGGSTKLTDPERGILLAAQAAYLRGIGLRTLSKDVEARASFAACINIISSVRGGRVKSMDWLVGAAHAELAALAESHGDLKQAKLDLAEAVALTAGEFPNSATLLAMRARLAGLLARTNETPAALNMFRDIVQSGANVQGGSEAIRGLMVPYFDTLVKQPKDDKLAADDFFAASQMLVRPGVAQTQAVFARELSGGSDEASSYFRQTLKLSREIVTADVDISRLLNIKERSIAEEALLIKLRNNRAEISAEQTKIIAKLSAFPKFRVLNQALLHIADLQAHLNAGDGYYKLLIVGDQVYGLFVQPNSSRIFKLNTRRADLETISASLRASILTEQAGQQTTLPFDVVLARKLYQTLFEAVDSDMPHIKHLVYEPDGPLLKLPANLLVTAQAGVDAYVQRLTKPNADEFDFTGVAWLGRDRMVSTAVSPQAFIDVRTLPPSRAKRRYLGLGQNTPVSELPLAHQPTGERDACDWPISLWSKPIKADELLLAAKMLGGKGDEVITKVDFSDTAIKQRTDLNDFRIIQFATHGLVTAPRPECPARPALLTSFGGGDSDGLLSFKEIFDLRLDADTIILSACDTAGTASATATREAGVRTGGNFPLDGLVRAFVGAGARAVIASHWPVPDDYNATKKLMSGIYEGGTHLSVGEAMRRSQVRLMDDPVTSHPYYWAAFAIVGDANKPLTGD